MTGHRGRAVTLRLALGVLGALLLLVPSGHAADGSAEADSGSITPEALLQRIQDHTAPVIIDVRTEGEYRAGHVPGAIHIPFWSIAGRMDEIPAAEDETVVVYCAHGPRAVIAEGILRMGGYDSVMTLEGHMTAWSKAGLPEEVESP